MCSCSDDPFGEYPSGYWLSESRKAPPGGAADFGARQTHFVGMFIFGLLPSLTASAGVQVHQAQAVALQIADSTPATVATRPACSTSVQRRPLENNPR
jgi:hypothetical protein